MSAPESELFGRPKGIAAVLDTSVLVRAWLSASASPNPSRRVMLLAGQAYDALISPAILDELEEVLQELRFSAPGARVRAWYDAFLRCSRQVFPEVIPGGDAAAIGGDLEDLPVLHTAYAAAVSGADVAEVLAAARDDGGWFIVSEDTGDFPPGRTVYGCGSLRLGSSSEYSGVGLASTCSWQLRGQLRVQRRTKSGEQGPRPVSTSRKFQLNACKREPIEGH